MNIIILGPQGSGKGTQAELVAKKYNLLHIETGKILRQIARSDSPLAKIVDEVMREGKLVSDEVLKTVISDVLKTPDKEGFVFDGTPRDIQQYDLIREILEKNGNKIDALILLEISEEETIKRLSSRRTCRICANVYNTVTKPSPNGDLCECGGELVQRDDDFPEAIKKRLRSYHEKTSQVITKADSENFLYRIDGERPIQAIFGEIVKIIDNLNAKNTDKNK